MDRKQFLKFLGALIIFPFAWIWSGLVHREEEYGIKKESYRISNDIPAGVSFAGKFIIYKKNEEISIFLARCTHLGCLINKEEDGQLVCPCHGSRYNPSNGEVLKGPAASALEKMNFRIDKSTDQIVINAG